MTSAPPKCPNKAEYIYAWGNELVSGCHRHANAMQALAQAIGSPFSAVPDVAGMATGKQCEQSDDLPKEGE